jgi:hypothetical protein
MFLENQQYLTMNVWKENLKMILNLELKKNVIISICFLEKNFFRLIKDFKEGSIFEEN